MDKYNGQKKEEKTRCMKEGGQNKIEKIRWKKKNDKKSWPAEDGQT